MKGQGCFVTSTISALMVRRRHIGAVSNHEWRGSNLRALLRDAHKSALLRMKESLTYTGLQGAGTMR